MSFRRKRRAPVMGMVEFLWGLSDGINGDGLSVALAYGGSRNVGEGFGICTILRYVLETCADVPEALATLERLPSHMDYNLVLADAAGRTASVEMHAGGGATPRRPAIATTHQLDAPLPDRAAITRKVERRAELARIARDGDPGDPALARFLDAPLRQTDYSGGFGTLFTAAYDPGRGAMRLVWPGEEMAQSLDAFVPGTVTIRYATDAPRPAPDLADLVATFPPAERAEAERWLAEAEAGHPDWVAFGAVMARSWSAAPAAAGD